MCEGGKSVVCIFNNGHTYDTYAPAHTSLLVLETKNLRIFIYRQISIASPRVEQVCIHARGDPFVSDPRNANNEPRNGSQGRHDARVATVWCSVGISWQTNSSREKKRKVSGKLGKQKSMRNSPSGQSTPTIIIIPHKGGESKWNEDHEHPEPATLRSEAGAQVRLSMVRAIAINAARVRDQTIRCALIPVGLAVFARVVVW